MAAGAALAAAVIPADICYVDTDNYLLNLGCLNRAVSI